MSAARTSRIRIGAGGIMLPNHAPIMVAEQFGTLEALFPGPRRSRCRTRTGHGSADDASAAADAEQQSGRIPTRPRRTHGVSPRSRARAGDPRHSRRGCEVPIWVLGSSLFGAQVAAAFGLPFAFASHFAPTLLMDAIAIYRERFEPSAAAGEPY